MRLSSEVSAHPRDRAEDNPFPLETKHHCFVPQGTSKKLKIGINSSSGSLLS